MMREREPRMELSVVRTVFALEMHGLLRDRRALFLAVVLPIVLFPLLFFGMNELRGASQRSLEVQTLSVGHDLEALDIELAQRILTGWYDQELRLALTQVEIDPEVLEEGRESEARAALGDLALFVRARPGEDGRPELALYFDGSQNRANEARRRVGSALVAVSDEIRAERLVDLVGEDPASELEAEPRDVAAAEDATGHALGKLLPLIAVLILISGGSFAALGAFAGERENGTIETLLVQPVSATGLAAGKFLAVIVTAGAALLGNAASFFFCIAKGWGGVPGVEEGALLPSLGRIALGMCFFAPTAVFLAALLCLVSARAKSFREGQHYVLPLMIVSAILASLSTLDRVQTGPVLAIIPVTGPTLVLRDTLSGHYALFPALLSIVTSCVWAWLAISRLGVTLDAERVFRGRDDPEEMAARRVQSRLAVRWGLASIVLVYLVGSRLQAWDGIKGLLLLLWVVVPALALLAARGTARRAGEPLKKTLGLVRPQPLHLAAALCLAPALAAAVAQIYTWQSQVIPLPQGFEQVEFFERLLDLPIVALLFVVAVSPGWNEELLFRGALLSGMRRDLTPTSTILWQGLLFGAVHLSIHRFLPTGLVGMILAALTLRARSLWPAVVLHTAYNSVVVLELPERGLPFLATAGALTVPGVACLLAAEKRRTRGPS